MKTIYEFLLKNKTITSTQQGIDYVDLGLPSRLLWATCNIGADEPTEYGDYFMWGSTEPNANDKCYWKNTPFNDGDKVYNAKYFSSIQNNVCPNSVLAPKYDAASAILKDGWRMPTKEDFNELIDNTKNKFIPSYKGSKIKGVLFMSKTNDSELFIPAAGFYNDSGFNEGGFGAVVWSSSLNSAKPSNAFYIAFSRFGGDVFHIIRNNAFSIRAVKNK